MSNKHTTVKLDSSAMKPRYWPTWLGVALLAFVSLLPHSAVVSIGKAVGWLFYCLAGRRRHICRVNLSLCFPNLSDRELDQLVKSTMIDQGIGMLEMVESWFKPIQHFNSRLEFVGEEYLREAEKQGQGVLVLVTHFTMLDLVGVLFANRLSIDTTYRKHKNPVIEWWLSRSRSRYGQVIERKEIKKTLRLLRNGHRVSYLPDQDYGRKSSVFASLFGIPAATITGASTIAKAGRAKVVFLNNLRLENGKKYRLEIVPMENFPSGVHLQDATEINAQLEKAISKAPHQYMWVHRRFKTRPEGCPKVY